MCHSIFCARFVCLSYCLNICVFEYLNQKKNVWVMNTILLVEDEPPIRLMLSFALNKAGFNTIEAGDKENAELLLEDHNPDLILMDWMLPDGSGIDMVKSLKNNRETQSIPVFMLTAMCTEENVIKGLDAGADDYVIKPFSPMELIARINAALRRKNNHQENEVLNINDLMIDKSTHAVTINNEAIELGPTEFRLLTFLAEHQERSYSRNNLLTQVWSRSAFVEERTVDVHILRLRQALSPWGYDKYIQTVRGIGYRFVAEQAKIAS